MESQKEYRFNEEIVKGKANHIHQLYDEGEWKNLIGTSTALGVLAKPLTWWASGLAVTELGWIKAGDWKLLKTKEQKEADLVRRIAHTSPIFDEIKDLAVEDYIKRLDKAYKAHSVKLDSSAEKGKDLHAELERFVKDHMSGEYKTPDDYEAKIEPFIRWTEKNVKRFLWSELHVYSRSLWLGGITDAGAELNDGSFVIVDFKSSKEAYDSHFLQIGGYDLQLSENGGFTKDGERIFTLEKPISQYIVVPFGAEVPEPVAVKSVEKHKEIFKHVLEIYRWTLLK
jgi:hypothetical protein